MNNLIINGIDYSKFDLIWAECGGTLAIVDSPSNKVRNLGVYVRGNETGNVKPYIRSLQANGIAPAEYGYTAFLDLCIGKSITTILGERIHLRMATPAECAEAGVEYIEPPSRWLPIERAPMHKDVLRLYYDGSMSVGWIYSDGEDSVGKDVRAWQPLPQPPKDE